VVLAETLSERGASSAAAPRARHAGRSATEVTGKEAEWCCSRHMTCNKTASQRPAKADGDGHPPRHAGADDAPAARAKRSGRIIADVLDRPNDEASIAAVRARSRR
jgi:glycine hydroxymethyltransferase